MNLGDICEYCNLRAVDMPPVDEHDSINNAIDPCLGVLPGVAFACCGHGEQGYIAFTNGKRISFTLETVSDDTDGFDMRERLPLKVVIS